MTDDKPKPEPQKSHEWKVRPTGEPDADGWWPYEVYTEAQGVISTGKVKTK